MGKKWNNLKESINAKPLEYADNFFTFKANAKITDDSFTFNTYPAFQEAIDIKTNNYSNLILSKKQLNSDWVSTDFKRIDYKNGLATTLGFFAHNDNLALGPYYLYFDKNYEFWDLYVKHAQYSLVKGTPGTMHGNYTFFVEFIDDITCKIRHWFGDLIFYLSVDSEKTIQFITDRNEYTDFIYNIDENRLNLYKKINYTEKEKKSFTIQNYETSFKFVKDDVTYTINGYNKDTKKDNLKNNPTDLSEYQLYDYSRYIVRRGQYINNVWKWDPDNICDESESLEPITSKSKAGAITYNDFENLKTVKLTLDLVDKNTAASKTEAELIDISTDILTANENPYIWEIEGGRYQKTEYELFNNHHGSAHHDTSDGEGGTTDYVEDSGCAYWGDCGIYVNEDSTKFFRDVFILAIKPAKDENSKADHILIRKVIEVKNPNEYDAPKLAKNYITITRNGTFYTNQITTGEQKAIKLFYRNVWFWDNEISHSGGKFEAPKLEAHLNIPKTAVFKIKASVDKTNNFALLALDENIESTDDSIITVNSLKDLDFNPNSSYIKYDRSLSINSIDMYYSQFNLQNQVLFHHEYNTDKNINFIPLKNHLTYKGSSIRGNNTTISDIKYADVDFRTYNSINSGINQETGTDTITLSYTFEDQEYVVQPGEDLFIYIPEENKELGIYPLYPYKRLNIADTKFIKNGVFASDAPFFADKIKKLQTKTAVKTEKYKLENGKLIKEKSEDPAYENSATYLCTWLYQKNYESEPIWLDRYYYPDLLSKRNALKGKSVLSKTLGSIIDKNYVNIESHVEGNSGETTQIGIMLKKGEKADELIAENPFFDKVSDMVIEAGSKYKFSHISSDMVDDVLYNNIRERINTVENKYGNPENIRDYINFGGTNYRRIDYSQWNNTNAINFNTDIYIDPSKPMGIQLIGTDYCSGFNIQNRKDLAPLHYYSSENTVYLLDDNYNVSRKFKLYEKYKEKIKRMVLGDVFDDVILMTDEAIYFLSYDLKVKSRIEYTKLHYYGNIKDDDGKDLSKITINSVLAAKFCKYTPTFYKNNLYIPFIQSILKVVLIPENEEDAKADDAKSDKVAAVRKLGTSEYYVTYNKEDETADSEESIAEYDGTENGFINVKKLIKHIYIDKDGYIYGLNFDTYSIAPDCDTMYGLYNSEADRAQGGWSWIFNTRLSKVRANLDTAKYAEFGSPNSIDFVRFNMNGEMGLIRSFETALWNTNDDNIKRMEIYDRTKRLIYTFDMRGYSKVYAFDAYNYITQNGEERTVFVAIADKTSGDSGTIQLHKVMYISNKDGAGTVEEDYIIDCKEAPVIVPFESVNNNAIMRYFGTNKLYFNLYLPSINMYNKSLTIEWDIADLQVGWYNINVAIDLKKAIFELRVNDVIYDTITSENNSDFIKNVNADGIIFNTAYYIGCIGKQYGSTLNDVLSSNVYDAYICKNCRMENMTIYTKTLSYHEYQAMRLNGKPLYPLSLTLPCGSRNNIEEIVRYFKYTYPGSISNKVKINISGTGITNPGEIEILRNEILSALAEEVDCLVDINDIEFI